MKHFFTRFFCLLLCFCLTSGVLASDLPIEQNKEAQEKIKNFVGFMQTLNQAAKTQSPEEADLKKHADKYNLLSPVYLMQTDASPLSGTRGYGQWQTTPFGKIRLISCYSGIKNNTSVFAGLQVMANYEWVVQKPILSTQTPAVQFLYPLMYPLSAGQTKTNAYEGALIFPILADISNTTEPFTLAIESTLTACKRGICETVTTPLSLTLTPEDHYPTGICPLMIQALQTAPLPPKDSLEGAAVLDKKGDIQIALTLEKPTALISIQIDNAWSFEELSKNIQADKALIVIRPLSKVMAGETLELKVITSYGFYDIPLRLTEGSFQTFTPNFPYTSLLLGGLALFFLTPFLTFFLGLKPRTQKVFKATAKEMLLCIGCVTILTGLLWQASILTPLSYVQTSSVCAVLAFLVVATLAVRPRVSLIGCFILFWLVPKPYLSDVFAATGQHGIYPFFIALFWGAFLCLPFWWMYRKPAAAFAFASLLKSAPKPIERFARLPFVLLLIWLVIGGAGNALVNKGIPLYTPENLTQALDQNKIVFVSVESPVCFSCVWNKAVILRTGSARSFMRAHKLIQLRAPLNSAEGQLLLRSKGKGNNSAALLYGPENKDGLVLPSFIEYFKLKEYIRAVYVD